MAEETFTISPTTNDASINSHSGTYATARAAASGTIQDGSLAYAGQYLYAIYTYYIHRAYMSFDTSSIPDDATIDAVELQIFINTKYGSGWSLQLQDGTPTYPHTPVEAGDYDQSNYSGDGGSLAVASMTTGQYNTITLNATGRGWISKTGNTKLCLRSTEDIGDSAPTGNEYCTFGQSNDIPGHRPKLVVTYTNVTYPTVSTDAASSIARTTVTLNGTLDDDGGEACNCCFEWGVNKTYGTTTAVQSKTTGQTFLQALTGMLPNTIYHYRSKSTNTAGTTYGADASFQMLAPQGGGIVSGLVGTLRHIWEPGMYRLEVGIGGYGLAMTTIPTGDAEDGSPEDASDWVEQMIAEAKGKEAQEKVRVWLEAMRQYLRQMYKPWGQKSLSWEQLKSLAEYGPYQDVKDMVAAMTSWKAQMAAAIKGAGGAGAAPVAGIGAWSAIAGRIGGIGGIRHSPTTNELHISRKPYRPLSAGPNAVRLKEVTKSPQYLTYVTDVEFSSTDHDTVAWTSGLVKLSNGYIGPVASGALDLTAAGRYYIYYTVGDNSLNNTVDFDTSLSSTSVLMAICEKVASGGKAKVFAPRSGISGYTTAGDLADHIAASNPHTVTLDQAYTGGQTIDVDTASLAINLSGAHDLNIQDAGTTVHQFDDSGLYNQIVKAASPLLLNVSGTWTADGAQAGKYMWDIQPIHDAGNSTTLTGSWAGLYLIATESTNYIGGTGIVGNNTYGMYYRSNVASSVSGSPETVTFGARGIDGYSEMSGNVTISSGTVSRTSLGIYGYARTQGTINMTGGTCTDGVYGVYGYAKGTQISYTAGTYTANLYGGYFRAAGTTDGTSTAYGIYATATGADTNYAGYFSGAVTVVGTVTATTLTDGTFSVNSGVITGATHTNWDAAHAHVSADGSSHTFLDQSVISGAAPTFTADNFSDGGTNAIVTTTQETNWDNHIADNTQAHSDYIINTDGDTATVVNTNFIFNLTGTGDLVVQDDGTPFFTLSDAGKIDIDAPAGLNKALEFSQTYDQITSGIYGAYFNKNWLSASNPTAAVTQWGYYFGLQLNTDIDGGGGLFRIIYGRGVYAKLSNDLDVISATGAWTIAGAALYGGGYDTGDDASDQNISRIIRGLEFEAFSTPTMNKAGGTLTARADGVYAHAKVDPVITAGTFVGTAYGAYLIAQGTTEGTSTTYGLYAKGYNADTNYAAYFDNGDVYIANDLEVVAVTKLATAGVGTLDGANPTTITIGVTMPNTTYAVLITPIGTVVSSNDDPDIYKVSNKTTTTFDVYAWWENSADGKLDPSTSNTATFNWLVIDY